MIRRAAACALLLAAAGLAGCREAPPPRAGLPAECAPSVPDAPRTLPASFPQPAGRVLAGAPVTSGQMTQVDGFVEGQPGEVVAALAAQPSLTVIAQEDERVDAELTVSDGEHRSIFKLVRACAAGSRFTAVQAPEPPG